MDGPITRATVTVALRKMPPQEHPFLGSPFQIGEAKNHSPNRSAVPMTSAHPLMVLPYPHAHAPACLRPLYLSPGRRG